MKKLLVLLSVMLVAAACNKQTTNRNLAAPNNNKAAEAKPLTNMTQAEMEVREKASWEALVKKNYGQFADMLADDYLDVEYGGVLDKAALAKVLPDLGISETAFSDWKMLPIDKDAVIITYNMTFKGTFKGQSTPPGPYSTTSVWANRNGKWLAVFYQQTAIDTTPPPPAAKTSAKPNTNTADTTSVPDGGGDPIANEKAVWALFRLKQYEAFAALLLPEFIKVAPEAVYDKAGSVKRVSMFDASKAELSDWKSVKIDAAATVVTYLVQLPGAPLQRHSSVWVNRDGKLRALFHQSTPQTPQTAPPAAKK